MSKFKIIVLFIICSFQIVYAKNKSDSLLLQLTKSKPDTNKINLLHGLILNYGGNDNSKAIRFAEEAVLLSEKLQFKLDKSYEELAWLLKNTADYKKSLEIYFKWEKYALSFKSPEKEKKMASVHTGLASVYAQLGNYDLAIEKGKLAHELYTQLNDKDGISYSNLNLGNYYYYKADYKNALKFYKESETAMLSSKDTAYLPHCYNSIAGVLYQLKNYRGALSYYDKAYDLFYKNDADDLSNLAVSLQNIGQTQAQLGNIKLAIENCLQAAELFRKSNDIKNLYNTYENIADYYAYIGDYKTSNQFYSSYIHLKDSIFDEDTKSTLHELSVKYETEKKEKENEVLSLENKNKKQIIYIVAGACLFLSCLVFFIYFIYRNKKKSHKLLEEKNTIINHQKEIVEEQNLEIKDSIRYAHRIQGAILPPRNLWQQILPDSFVLHIPKDILSGDFYWIEETKDYIYIAAADCTGHGVPGALISIVCYNLLNKAVLEKNLVTPAEILDAVNVWLTESLHQTYRESKVKDGMDVSLIAIHKHSNEILFAGANNPVYIVSKGELKQLKGDKFPVGAFIEDKIHKFNNKTFKAYPGDMIYLFSDGFADQFGGENGKKYKYTHFQEKLIAISERSPAEQRNGLKDEFYFWKGPHEQVDDVLVIGIKKA